MFYITISERIIEIRKNEGLNQVQFAKKLNLTKQTISNYETGSRSPGLDIILNIADKFNVSTDYLLGRSEYKTIEAQKLSTSTIFSIEAINKLTNIANENIKVLNTLLSINGFDSLLKLFFYYQNLSDEEVEAYATMLSITSSESTVSSEQNISYIKKSYMDSAFKKVIGEIQNDLDTLDDLEVFRITEDLNKKMRKSEVYTNVSRKKE